MPTPRENVMSEQRAPTSEEVIFIALVRSQRFLMQYLNGEQPSKVEGIALRDVIRRALAVAKGNA
jgi:hypothetical protein